MERGTLAENVERYRKAAGLSRRELVELSGVSSARMIEYGMRRNCQAETLQKLATALNCSVDDLLRDDARGAK